MKPQDIIFLLVFLILLFKKDFRLTAIIGMLCIAVSIPLFAKWIFYTAQHLIWYSGAFFLLAVGQLMFKTYGNRN